MFKLCIALGWSVVRTALQSTFLAEYPEIWAKIRQHRFIMSEAINNYYLENAKKEGLLQEYRDFIQFMQAGDHCVEIKDLFPEIDRTLADYLKNRVKTIGIVISDGDFEISKSSCRYQYTLSEAAEDEKGPFGIYSVKASFLASEGERAETYLEWIKNIVHNEKEISIIDKNAISDLRNMQCLIDYYFPLLQPGTKINLHVPDGSPYEEAFVNEARNSNLNIQIYKYSRMKHDRYITTSKRIIVVSVGIDFMRREKGIAVLRTDVNFDLKGKNNKLKNQEEEIALSGTLREAYEG